MGLYPFVIMFPLLAASGGNPPEGAIAGWGIAASLVALTVGAARRTERSVEGRFDRATTVSQVKA
jgi:hypothetical protein